MSKHVQFYLIEKTQPQGELSAEETLACDLAADAWRLGKKV
ncbi:MAG TPA: DNA polymerase III subunit chi, partial [Pasteurellaceae bacterium]|nr:DNA polymerase III subunit chi [Pasteurellaceae bacterium]